MANMGRCWFFELLQISSDRILPARHPFWPEDEFFHIGRLFLTLYADFSIDARALFRHFYIWTSKRIEVRNTTAITCD
jgi:hypothetical protein